ncbi:MAG: alkaline phosphatase family protein [Victivallales bacterium]|nr:alkaline phosphatase family protein [Victivallales bacterium]
MKKVVLILVDGMRPESLEACGHPFVKELLSHSVYTLKGQTVMPSVTLPCHVSLFHSVPSERHGILTNTYVPQVRPIQGICEVLKAAGKKSALFYNWEPLKDLARPGSLCYANFIAGNSYGYEEANRQLTENAISFLRTNVADFTFLYLGWTDEAGHAKGWMGEEYLRSVYESFASIEAVVRALSNDYLVIVTADHGGHDRSHGTEMPEDMTIPILFYNPAFPVRELNEANIIDIAPTIVQTLGVAPDGDWEGHTLQL